MILWLINASIPRKDTAKVKRILEIHDLYACILGDDDFSLGKRDIAIVQFCIEVLNLNVSVL